MDFFEYASVVSPFVEKLWVQLLVGGLCFAIVFIFQAIALFTIARREGYNHKWMAFIPFLNTYYIGVCAQKNKFHTLDAKTIGIVTASLELVLFVLYVVYYVAQYKISGYLIEVDSENTTLGIITKTYDYSAVPDNLNWAVWMFRYMGYILNVGDLVYILFEVCLLICFFQTYACRRYFIFTFTSVLFPIQGILFFVVRNNRGVNYREFVRNEQARQYRMYQQYQQQNFNQNPYNQNPYNNSPYDAPPEPDNKTGAPEDPFDDLGGSGGNDGGSPFDDFDK